MVEEPGVDYKALLIRYMAKVIDRESVALIDEQSNEVHLTSDEESQLKKIKELIAFNWNGIVSQNKVTYIKEARVYKNEHERDAGHQYQIRTKSHQGSFEHFMNMWDQAKRDFPDLYPEDCEVIQYFDYTYGIEFSFSGIVRNGYTLRDSFPEMLKRDS